MRSLLTRVQMLEGATGAVTMRDAIDRPPLETREQWLARQGGAGRELKAPFAARPWLLTPCPRPIQSPS